MATNNPCKKRFSCSGCNAEFTKKPHCKNHINKKKSCNADVIPIIIEIMHINCPFCNAVVKTATEVDFMKKHMEKCIFKDQYQMINKPEINITNNINIILNSYASPTIDYLIKDVDNLAKNRSEIYRKTYYNINYPENHTIMYDRETNNVRFYENNNNYTDVPLDKSYGKIGWSLDKIQEYLLGYKYPDSDELRKEYAKMDVNINIDEAMNKNKCIQITLDNNKIPMQTRQLIENQKIIMDVL
jgi:hypothetical protein